MHPWSAGPDRNNGPQNLVKRPLDYNRQRPKAQICLTAGLIATGRKRLAKQTFVVLVVKNRGFLRHYRSIGMAGRILADFSTS